MSETQLERALLQKLQHVHGYDVLGCGTEDREDLADGSGRADKREVFLVERTRAAAVALNPSVPAAVIDGAIEKLVARRPALSAVAANREVFELIRDGVPVEFDDARGRRQQERVRFIDFATPDSPHNDFLGVAQLWVRREGISPARRAALRQRPASRWPISGRRSPALRPGVNVLNPFT